MVERKTWEEFRLNGLLWWANRILHLTGWAIVVVVELDGKISDIYPARVKFRGFDEKTESEGFGAVTKYMSDNSSILISEAFDL